MSSEPVVLNPTRILVPVDFSASSHEALETATGLAEKFGAEVVLVHVVPEYPGVVLPENVSQDAMIEAARTAAKQRFVVSKAAIEKRGVTCSTHIELGTDVAGTILDVVEREQADLLVFATHGVSGWYPQVFGSVAEKLVRLATCPILLLRTSKPESTAKVPFGRMMEWW